MFLLFQLIQLEYRDSLQRINANTQLGGSMLYYLLKTFLSIHCMHDDCTVKIIYI